MSLTHHARAMHAPTAVSAATPRKREEVVAATHDAARPAPVRLTPLPERNLDVLRSVAVLCVLADHVHRLYGPRIGPFDNGLVGSMGVYMFFVHTSLVLMSSLERGGDGAGWVRAFYLRRAFRIYPLAMVAVLATVLFRVPAFLEAWTPIPAYHAPTTRELLGNLSLAQNLLGVRGLLAQLWSLPVEVQMYVVLPFLYVAARRSTPLLAACLAAAFALAGITWLNMIEVIRMPGLWRLGMLLYAPCFVAGVVAYRLLRQRRVTAPLPGWTLGPALALAALCYLVAPRPWNGWGMCLALGIGIALLRDHGNAAVAKLAKVIAQYSYGIYLGHTFAIWIAFVTLRPYGQVLSWAAFVTLMVVLPWLGYHVVEAPAIRLGRRLTAAHR